MHLITSHGKVTLKPGAIVLFAENVSGTTIFDLSDNGRGSVKVEYQGHVFVLAPGQEIVFGSIPLRDHLARREISRFAISSQTISFADVSPVTLLSSNELLQIIRSSSTSEERAIVNKILKTAACLSLVTVSHGRFTRQNE